MKLYSYFARPKYDDADTVGVVQAESKKEAEKIIRNGYDCEFDSITVEEVEFKNGWCEIYYG